MSAPIDTTPGWVRFVARCRSALRMAELRRTTVQAIAHEVHRQRRMAYAVGFLALLVSLVVLLPGTMAPPQAGTVLLVITTVAGVALARGFFEPELSNSRLEERLQPAGFGPFLALRTTALVLAGLLALLPAVALVGIAYREETALLALVLAVGRTLLVVLGVACWCQCRLASVPAGLFLATVLLLPVSVALANMGGVLNPWQNPITVTWGTGARGESPPGLAALLPNVLVMIVLIRVLLRRSARRTWRLLRET